MTEPELRVLSLGAGVQSSTMALMAANGEVPRVHCAIFADTGDEPTAVMGWLDWLESVVSNPRRVEFPFPVYRVKHKSGNALSKEALKLRKSQKSGKTYLENMIPGWFVGGDGHAGMMARHCTRNFKIIPIRQKVRELVGGKTKPGMVEMCIGISTDEAIRIKPSPVKYITHNWPLINAGVSRQDCLAWMSKMDHPEPPRSACVYCPYHSNSEWSRLKTDDPEGFARAVEFERNYSQAAVDSTALHSTAVYFHKSLVPLDEAVFSDDDPNQLNLFGNECEGMCGV
jgi:hypothetical protein